MQEYTTGTGTSYRVEVNHAPFADAVFEGTGDAELYDLKLGVIEDTVRDMGEDPADEFFDAYQQAREDVDADLPDFTANAQYEADSRTQRETLLAFEADEPVDEDAFADTVEAALTETLTRAVTDWYGFGRVVTGYENADLSVAVDQREDEVDGTYFAIDTDPVAAGDVMSRAASRLTDTDV